MRNLMTTQHSTARLLMAEIRRVAAERNLSKSAIAKAAGLHVNTLLRLNDPDWDPRLSTLVALEGAILSPFHPRVNQ